jgi:hypothetical protein
MTIRLFFIEIKNLIKDKLVCGKTYFALSNAIRTAKADKTLAITHF